MRVGTSKKKRRRRLSASPSPVSYTHLDVYKRQTSGAGIFGAQFYGRGDMDGVRHTFRFKLLVSTAITAAAIMLFLAAGPALIGAYISADTSPADAAATLDLSLIHI